MKLETNHKDGPKYDKLKSRRSLRKLKSQALANKKPLLREQGLFQI
jgi:hypothetical protein